LPAALRATSRPRITWSLSRQLVEEPLQRDRIVRVEGGGAPRADVARCLLEALRVAAHEDDFGALRACQPSGLQSDAGAAADQDDGLSAERRLADCRGGNR
jgi:hypothetical protein